MANTVEPSLTDFQEKELLVKDVLLEQYPTTNTKAGTFIREILVRPLAYIYSWVINNLENILYKNSVAQLRSSELTENDVADALASNYFVTRKSATKSSGILTLTSTVGSICISENTRFTVDGHVALVSQTVLADTNDTTLLDDVLHIKISPETDGTYLVSVPVELEESGAIEITPGAPAESTTVLAHITSVELTSAITGGCEQETDAEMFARAEATVADPASGSLYGIKRALLNSPVTVTGVNVVGGDSELLVRGRLNNLGINPGGVFDVYVRTQPQGSVKEITLSQAKDSTGAAIANTFVTDARGIIRVLSATYTGLSEAAYTVTRNASATAKDLQIAFTGGTATGTASTTCTASVLYMPGVADISDYLTDDSRAYVGQNIYVDAAVPVTLALSCAVESTDLIDDDTLFAIKTTIAKKVNNMAVGAGLLNFSDICKAVSSAFPGVMLRLPCTITGEFIQKDGNTESFTTTTGIFDITTPDSSSFVDYKLCFFSLAQNNIDLVQI